MATRKKAVALAAFSPDVPLVKQFGFIHDKDEANSVIGVTDCVEDTFFVLFNENPYPKSYVFDVEIDSHKYSVKYEPKSGQTGKAYWRLGTSKATTQFDWVDEKAISEDTNAWPTVTPAIQTATLTVREFDLDDGDYPQNFTPVYGLDEELMAERSITVSTSSASNEVLTPKEEEEPEMPDNTLDKDTALVGCPFDSITAQAVHGKNVILAVIDREGNLLGVAGQQGLTWNIELNTTEADTKDKAGAWTLKFAGQKSWTCSTDGLYCHEDPARKTVIKALVDGELLCVAMLKWEKTDDGQYLYTPLRKGIALPTTDELEAPQDDNMTFSLNFEGTGECWTYETASEQEIEDCSFVTEDPLI